MKTLGELAKHWHPQTRIEIDAKNQLLIQLAHIDIEIARLEKIEVELTGRVKELERKFADTMTRRSDIPRDTTRSNTA